MLLLSKRKKGERKRRKKEAGKDEDKDVCIVFWSTDKKEEYLFPIPPTPKGGGGGEEVLDEWKSENCIGAPDGTGLVWSLFFFFFSCSFFFFEGGCDILFDSVVGSCMGTWEKMVIVSGDSVHVWVELKVKTRWTEEYIHN